MVTLSKTQLENTKLRMLLPPFRHFWVNVKFSSEHVVFKDIRNTTLKFRQC